MTHEILHPKNWKPAKGYANGVLAEGRLVILGGQIGWNADQVFETDDFVGQTRQTVDRRTDPMRLVLGDDEGRNANWVRHLGGSARENWEPETSNVSAPMASGGA